MTFQSYPPQLLQKARETYWGELAWHVCDIPDVLEYAHSENLVILGGDVITPQESTPTTTGITIYLTASPLRRTYRQALT